MPRIIQLFFSVLVLILVNSCSSGDSVEDGSIYHKWFYKEKIENGVTIPYTYGNCGKDYVQFYHNGNVKFVSIISCQPLIAPTSTFTLTENSITITHHGNVETTTSTGTITELTPHNLTIVYNYTFNINGELIVGNAERYER